MTHGDTRADAVSGGVHASDADRTRPAGARSWRAAGVTPGWVLAGALVAVALIPFTLMGPGTDLDVGVVLRSGMGIVDGGYVASRAPGAPVHEAGVGVLEWIGGTVGPNLGSLAAGIGVTVLLALLLRGEGVGRVGLSVAVVVANPWFLIAATSTVDFLWALALWLGAAVVLRRQPTLVGAAGAGALAGLAVGARASTAFLVAGLALAEALDRAPSDARTAGAGLAGQAEGTAATAAGTDVDTRVATVGADGSPALGGPGALPTTELDVVTLRDGRAEDPPTAAGPSAVVRALVFAGVAAAAGLVVFLPPFLAAESSLAFAQNDVPTSTVFVQVGRFLAKDLYFVGPFAAVVLLLALPALVRSLARFRSDWLVRLGLLTLVISQLLFLRFPWKMGHLLPTLIGLALLLARALGDRPRLLVALVATQLLYGLVSIQLLAPDNPNAATGGELTFEPRWGAVVVDTQCRLDDPDAWQAPLPGDPDVSPSNEPARIDAVWDCAKPWAE